MSKLKDLITRSHELWNLPGVPERIRRHNRKAWVRSVVRLGNRWLLAKPVGRLE